MGDSRTENKPSHLGRVIESLIASMGQSDKYYGWRIVAQWPDIVGPEIARVSKAVRFSEGILTVVVEKDVWRQELEMQLDKIFTKVKSQPGGQVVNKIVLKAGY